MLYLKRIGRCLLHPPYPHPPTARTRKRLDRVATLRVGFASDWREDGFVVAYDPEDAVAVSTIIFYPQRALHSPRQSIDLPTYPPSNRFTPTEKVFPHLPNITQLKFRHRTSRPLWKCYKVCKRNGVYSHMKLKEAAFSIVVSMIRCGE